MKKYGAVLFLSIFIFSQTNVPSVTTHLSVIISILCPHFSAFNQTLFKPEPERVSSDEKVVVTLMEDVHRYSCDPNNVN